MFRGRARGSSTRSDKISWQFRRHGGSRSQRNERLIIGCIEYPEETFVRGAVTLLIVGTVIATLGLAAGALYVFRRRVRERFLLSFGLFSILYGIALVVRNSAFRLGFGQPRNVGLSVE